MKERVRVVRLLDGIAVHQDFDRGILYSVVCTSPRDTLPDWPAHGDDPRWIEYIPEAGLVEQDGCLWWRGYDPHTDAMRYTQITKYEPECPVCGTKETCGLCRS